MLLILVINLSNLGYKKNQRLFLLHLYSLLARRKKYIPDFYVPTVLSDNEQTHDKQDNR